MKKLFPLLQVLGFCFYSHSAFAENFKQAPDAVIATRSLSSLPKDIIKIPILKDLLTEDFVFYYNEGGADWLSFKGALARISFEQKTDWPSQVLAWLLNSPAEIALWKGNDGKLNHFMVVIDQTGVKALIESMVKSSTAFPNDKQLADENSEVNKKKVQVLNLGTDRKVYLVSEDNLFFIYSDLSMALPSKDRTVKDRIMSFLGVSDQIGVFGPKLGNSSHILTVNANYLSFGYQAFFDSIKAFQFQYDEQGWKTSVLTSTELKLPDPKDWAQLPRGAAFCVALPVDKKKIESIIKAGRWLEKATDTAISCWYPSSKLYSPVLALRGDYSELMQNSDELKKLFNSVIGSKEALWKPAAEEGGAPTLIYKKKLDVKVEAQDSQLSLTREVGGRFGLYSSKKSSDSTKLGSKRFFRVKLSVTPGSIIFSPDDQLVDQSLSTVTGKFPSMQTMLSSKVSGTSVFISPEAFAKLAKSSILESLPQAQESIFRGAVSRHLFPNLDKFAKRPAQTASLGATDDSNKSASGLRWKTLDWVSNAVK